MAKKNNRSIKANQKKKIEENDFWDTLTDSSQVPIPKNPLERVIGQENAKRKAYICARQHRHLLLIGPPGTGKSMIARAMAELLPKPKEEVWIIENPKNPERPIIEVVKKDDKLKIPGIVLSPHELPFTVAEKMGFRCRRCATLSDHRIPVCPHCGAEKYVQTPDSLSHLQVLLPPRREKQTKVEYTYKGKPYIFVLEENESGDVVRAVPKEEWFLYEKIMGLNRRVLIPLERNTFVQCSGASETELLGDVRHDPYGSHPKIGTPVFKRVVPGAVHEAHEGVLFIDEISTLGELQRYLLTAMQDKRFPITGRNPTGSGSSVRVDNVPCDFILVGAANVNDVNKILPALRSRVLGDGYEVLMDTVMPETEENKHKLYQFIAQEIEKDGRIPPMSREAMDEVVRYASSVARKIDHSPGYTLRLRILSGVIRAAGDLAIMDEEGYILPKHIKEGIKESASVDTQLNIRYSNWYSQSLSDRGY